MKLLSAVLVTLVFCASTFQVAAEDQSPTKPATQVCVLKVSGMTCAGCEAAVKIAARSVEMSRPVTRRRMPKSFTILRKRARTPSRKSSPISQDSKRSPLKAPQKVGRGGIGNE